MSLKVKGFIFALLMLVSIATLFIFESEFIQTLSGLGIVFWFFMSFIHFDKHLENNKK